MAFAKEPEGVPRDGVFRMLVPHAGFLALPAQDRVQTCLVFRVSPKKVPPLVVIDVRETTASGMHSKVMRRTRTCLDTAAHWAGIASSEAEFRDTEWHGIIHGVEVYATSTDRRSVLAFSAFRADHAAGNCYDC